MSFVIVTGLVTESRLSLIDLRTENSQPALTAHRQSANLRASPLIQPTVENSWFIRPLPANHCTESPDPLTKDRAALSARRRFADDFRR
jgi:hypothetical protein